MVAYSTSLDVSQSAQSPERDQLARRVAESTRRFPILSCIGRATSPERVVVETAAAAVSSQRSDSITGEEYCLLRPRIAGEATPCKDASENVLHPQEAFGLKQNCVAFEIAKTKCEFQQACLRRLSYASEALFATTNGSVLILGGFII